ncbi:MAG: AAA family ATPase [Treponema sp.]|uniref:ATP-binding protein n=1 Tax=Treponema sp. TaxID=166 RepID=UPI0025D776F9|nr:ATP-binding protein [Treponema sp.]MBQ8679790.1 AAA family ATPase [Treponema sp.]
MANRFLPIGIQDFEDLRNRGAVYVDKTHLVYKLATEGKPYFLSRPRRFGKSLLLSTLEAYFLGKKDLFKGLAIENLEKDWVEYPVIKISFGADNYPDLNCLISLENSVLSEYEKKYDVAVSDSRAAPRLKNIIKSAYEKTGKQVVILIDEYDKPILDALYTQYEEQNRQELRSFYSPLKDCDQYIRFLFITGITKVSHVNIFSGLNQLNDISLTEKYSSICGISESELEQYFIPEIEALAERQEMNLEETKEKLAQMYDGYHFTHDVEGVYNPFCLLKCFSDKDFGSYWFESGTPSLLVKTLQNQPLELTTIINGRKAKEDQFKNYDPDSKNMLPVIYQSGYLTIKDFDKTKRIYTLDFPNREIEDGFINILLKKFVTVPYDDLGLAIGNLCDALELHDLDQALNIIKSAIADLPTVVKKDMCENYYESVTHLMFRMTGWRVVSELQNVCGRSDVVVASKDSVFIFELKMDKGKPFEEVAEEALAQIDTNGYSQRFAVSGKAMYKVALVFSSEGKGLLGWKVKE